MSGARLVLGVLPLALALHAGREAALGPPSVDLLGHLWMGWSVARGEWPRTTLLNWPEGVDLLPALGGWLDLALVGAMEPALGLVGAYNLTLALYLAVAGLGGAALARALGAAPWPAAVAGLLLQLDPALLHHLQGGRPEQVGTGFVALALAAAIGNWRGSVGAWRCGLAGALVVAVSWEATLLLAALMPALGLALRLAEPQPEGPRRWARAAGVALALAGPWVLAFLLRTSAVRAVDEGAFTLETAARASVGLLGWLGPGQARPSWAALAALALAPLLLKPRPGPARVLGATLAASLALALGPWPGLMAPGAPEGSPWGPFAALRGLPVLGWYHWPDRLLLVWSLAGAAGAALVVQRPSRPLARLALGGALLLGAAAELGPRLPLGRTPIEARPGPAALAALDEPGAVLDLPVQAEPPHHLPYMVDQLTHARPILFHILPAHLDGGGARRRAEGDRVLRWFYALTEKAPPPPPGFTRDDFEGLRRQGFRFLVLHQAGWPGDRWQQADAALREALGRPDLQDGRAWQCWRLGDVPRGTAP